MSATVTPDQVVAAARSYIGTRWHHQGRNRAGLDCVGLIVCVAHDLGVSDFDSRDYGRLPSADALREGLRAHCIELPVAALAPGLLALMRFEREPQHLAFTADYLYGGLSIVHALAQSRRVVEQRLDDLWRGRIVALYQMPGVEYAA
jgi:hypothetical protein